MKVLHVISSIDPRSGGPAEALRGLVKAQCRAGLDVRILATWVHDDQLDLSEKLLEVGARLQLIGPCRVPLRWHPKLRSTIAEEVKGTDVVHVHGLWEEIQ